MQKLLITALLAVAVSGCATWSHSSVKPAEGQNLTAAPSKPVEKVMVTKGDITDREYKVLGDISATVNKTTIFHDDPTPELVDEKLRKEAARIGADAVILVRYGNPGISLMSWGSLEGKGRAIVFVE